MIAVTWSSLKRIPAEHLNFKLGGWDQELLRNGWLENTPVPELREGAVEEARQTVKKESLEGETEKTKEFC